MAEKNLSALKSEAIKKGMNRSEARSASRDALMKFLSGGSKPTKKASAVKKSSATKKASTTATKKAPARKPATRNAPARKPATRQAAKKSTSNSKPKATSNRRAPAKPTGNGGNGWKVVGKLDWTGYDKEAWNPRAESGVGIIFKALKKYRGNRDKAFDDLKSQINVLSPKTSRLGGKRNKAQQEAWLRYRINQTVHNFATKTGQHSPGTDRKPYERNGKPARSASTRAQAAKPKTTTRKRTSTTKPKATTKRTTTKRGTGGRSGTGRRAAARK